MKIQLAFSRRKEKKTRNSYVHNNRGIALVMVLLLSGISLGVMAGLLYMLVSSTQTSGMQKRYKTALEAGIGAGEYTYQLIQEQGDPGILGAGYDIVADAVLPGPVDCLTDKLTSATASWDAVCDSSLAIDPGTVTTYDLWIDLGASPTYRSYVKIADTVLGMVGSGEPDMIGGGVTKAEGSGAKHPHFYYTIEVDAQMQTNPMERAKLEILYEY